MVTWNRVSRAAVLRAMRDYDRPGPERFFSKYGFAPTTSYELACEKRRYPPKAILATAYEFATDKHLTAPVFPPSKSLEPSLLQQRGFTVQGKRRTAK